MKAGEKRTGRGPRPIERTVRRLFAEQVSCAHPDCDRPLIDVLDGKQIQICEIAHICAYAADGPRSVSTMTPEATRVFENLVLLCKDHHDLVDEHEPEYPATTLIEWKAAQRLLSTESGGEYLDDDQVEAALVRFTGPNEILVPFVAQIARIRSNLVSALGKASVLLSEILASETQRFNISTKAGLSSTRNPATGSRVTGFQRTGSASSNRRPQRSLRKELRRSSPSSLN